MSGPAADRGARTAPEPASRVAAPALAITLAIQIFAAVAATAVPVLAPEIGRDVGIAPKLVGVFVGILYAGSMLASLVSSMFIERHGAIRVSQASTLLCAAGVLLTSAATASVSSTFVLLALAPVIIGFGYGAITPASSQLLARTAPPSRRAITFSIKQTGVPAGAALAGGVLPLLTLHTDWRAAFALIAGTGVAIAAGAQLVRGALDADRTPATPSLARVLEPLRHVLRTPPLVELGVVAFVYAALQVCLISFLVVYLSESLGFSLVGAGLALTVATVGGVIGRIVWGVIADFHVAPRRLLALIGVAAGTCAGATAAFGTAWPIVAVLAVCATFGLTAVGWNGVQLAEVARIAPRNQVAAITGATNFVAFGGVVLGPPAFALIAGLTGSYRYGFAIFGGAAIGCGVWLLARRKK